MKERELCFNTSQGKPELACLVSTRVAERLSQLPCDDAVIGPPTRIARSERSGDRDLVAVTWENTG
eukprot:8664583-Lingulodinium_polyedra.AAC.1